MPRSHARAIGLLCSALLLGLGGCQTQESFKTPLDAASALDTAVRDQDRGDLQKLFGPRASELRSGDPEQDRDDFIVFSREIDAGLEVQMDGADMATLLIGTDKTPFAVPLAKTDGVWRFDTDAGIDEVTNRRIGRNELLNIAACQTLIQAQAEFYQEDPDGRGTKHYATRLMSTEGKKDGLYWPAAAGEDPSPIGPLLAEAATRRDAMGHRLPYNGYLYRPLREQGASAPGGAMSYAKGDLITEGWAAIAYPAEYGQTGVMSFLVSSHGAVYQRDLGAQTESVAQSMASFDPGPGWEPISP